MSTFFELEAGHLLIGLFILMVALFVGTREFVGNGKAWKKVVPLTLISIFGFISVHFFTTNSRMSEVKSYFNSGGAVICESKAVRKVAQTIIIDPKSTQNWVLIDNMFHSPEFSRGFHSSRCLVHKYSKPIIIN